MDYNTHLQIPISDIVCQYELDFSSSIFFAGIVKIMYLKISIIEELETVKIQLS